MEELILAAFRRADAEGRRDAAEHLMRALEALCPCLDVAPGGSALAEAYRDLAREAPAGPVDHGDGKAARRRGAGKRFH
ncbi:hypothetical protein [Caldovatus sediminis]|uniref:hypothetical protein n=1 Tax=Caldovatus sediminis TaxID=2041189 RepID=UPI001664A0C1|nr:hypothetical protein [Caldovatus sediminis]